ncbi:MAG: hypothetical protein IH614_14555, partial [Desulfuromonadales bacterium]|nr:hypothetical protein [Desulfuromonadales bacterium]
MPLEQQLVDFIAQSTALINEVTGKKGLLDEKVATATDQAAIAIAQAALAADQVTAAAAQVDAAADQVAAAAAQVDLALAQQNLAAAKAAESAASAVLSTEQAAIATQKAADAVAVVTGGTASLAPAAGKSPITGAGTTINPAWLDQLPSRAAFEKTANSRRQMFAGSGFVEWGKHDSGQPAINQGMFTYAAANSGVANMLFLGRSNTNLAGTSKTTFPVVAANGYLLRVDRVAEAGNPSAQIRLPPAPATADLLDREDLVFLEVWHEDVAEKDFIYPFGSVQFLAGAYVPPGGTSINTVVPTIANFGGIDTYSLFGNWQAAGALVGRGMKFSTMTAVQRQQFLSDPENNCYLDGDRIIQVRYRIRVVQGLGSAWKNVNPQNPSEYLNYSGGSTFVAAKGKLVVLASDYRVGNDNVFLPVNDAAAKAKSPGAFSILATSSVGAAYNNLCFAVPVALVHRRNQGAYHPIWNPNGTNSFRNSEGTTQQPWYSSTARVPTSTADCFNFWNGSDGIATWQPNGGIAGNSSGRPDGLFFDEINERDVRDLRNSAIKQADLRRTLEREFNKLVAGMTRGW